MRRNLKLLFTLEEIIMDDLKNNMEEYIEYCRTQKHLDRKTLKAYRIDLKQFAEYSLSDSQTESESTQIILERYIQLLHQTYSPRTVKRKIAALKAIFRYFEYKEIIFQNPFNKLRTKFREPSTLPKTIPLDVIEKLFNTMYQKYCKEKNSCQKKAVIRDIAVVELLFATGIRVSKLCS